MGTLTDTILNDIVAAYVGSRTVYHIYQGSVLVWPKNVEATLTVQWDYTNGSYNINNMSAGECYAYAKWYITLSRDGQQIGQPVQVTPTGLVSNSDPTNFPYTLATGVWNAHSRGTNGFVSGSSAPTAAQLNPGTRSCTIIVQYSGPVTVGGISYTVNATGTATMTQANNIGERYSAGDSTSISGVYLTKYNSTSSPAPASGCSANDDRASVSVYASTNQAYRWAATNSIAYKQVPLSSSSFNFSCSNPNVQSDGIWATPVRVGEFVYINVNSRGAVAGELRSIRVNATLASNSSITSYDTLYQQLNRIEPEQTIAEHDIVESYTLGLLRDIKKQGETVYLNGTWSGKHISAEYVYTSGAHSTPTQTNTGGDVVPMSYSVDGGSVVFSNVWEVGGCHSLTRKSYSVSATYQGCSDTKTYYQEADTLTSSTSYSDYKISISIASGSYNAGPNNSQVTYAWSASHDATTTTTWSDGTVYSTSFSDDVPDTITSISVDTSQSTAAGASNRVSRNGYTITHTTMSNNEGVDVIAVTVTHPLDSSRTSTNTLSIQNQRTVGSVTASIAAGYSSSIPAKGGSIGFTASCSISWSSGYPETATLTYTATAPNGSYRSYTWRGTILDLGSLTNNSRGQQSSTVKVSYSSSNYANVSFTELENKRHQEKIGTNTQYEEGTFTVSASKYSSQSGTWSPYTGSTDSVLRVTANHYEKYQDVYSYTWDSEYPEPNGTGSWGSRNLISDLSRLNITTNSDWLHVAALGSNGQAQITVDDNTGYPARDGYITVTRPAIGTLSAQSKGARIYQKAGDVAISLSPTTIYISASGGTATIYVSHTSTTWKITTQSWGFTGATITPAANSTGQTGDVITVVLPTSQGRIKQGTIKVTAEADTTKTATCLIKQTPEIDPDPED